MERRRCSWPHPSALCPTGRISRCEPSGRGSGNPPPCPIPCRLWVITDIVSPSQRMSTSWGKPRREPTLSVAFSLHRMVVLPGHRLRKMMHLHH